MKSRKIYAGIDKDPKGAMYPTGNIIRDAWVFGLIPGTETCTGWTVGQPEDLYPRVSDSWKPYGHLVSRLPDELRERHSCIYSAAIERARELGRDPEPDYNDG